MLLKKVICLWWLHRICSKISKVRTTKYFSFKMLWKSSFIVEPRYNKPHYNEVLGITNDWIFFAKAIVKYVENNLDITKPCYKEQISLSVSWPFVVSRYCSIDRLKPLSIHRQRKFTSSLYSHCLKGRKSASANSERYCGWFWVHSFSKKFERMAREAMDVCLRVLKESNSGSARNSVFIISHIAFQGLSRAHFFPTTFLEIAV